MSPSASLPSLARNFDRLKDAVPAVVDVLPVGAIGFYAAILVPLLYLPMLGGQGGLTGGEVPLFVALLLVNAGALVLGQGYRED